MTRPLDFRKNLFKSIKVMKMIKTCIRNSLRSQVTINHFFSMLKIRRNTKA